jgi:23S rRNA pseudouridine1911/1915/1917 synthase
MSEPWRLHTGTVDGAAPLFAAVADLVGISRVQARRAVLAGLVAVDGTPVREPNATPAGAVAVDLRHGVRAAWQAHRHGDTPGGKQLTILHRDDALVVVDKAAGVLSAPTRQGGLGGPGERGHVPELLRRILRKQGEESPFIGQVHRLDKDTSGCLCVALTRDAQRILSAQFAGEAAGRTYRCLVAGQPVADAAEVTGTMDRGRDGRRRFVEGGDDGEHAVTRYKVLRRFARGCELEVELGTGRTHQIRTTLAAMACPIWGDRVYNRRRRDGDPVAPRLMLHAVRLVLDHPVDGRRLSVEAPMPEAYLDFSRMLGHRRVQRDAPSQP